MMVGKKEGDGGGKIDGGAQGGAGGASRCLTGELFSASGGGGVEVRFSGFQGWQWASSGDITVYRSFGGRDSTVGDSAADGPRGAEEQ
jgi:hypothetical protein